MTLIESLEKLADEADEYVRHGVGVSAKLFSMKLRALLAAHKDGAVGENESGTRKSGETSMSNRESTIAGIIPTGSEGDSPTVSAAMEDVRRHYSWLRRECCNSGTILRFDALHDAILALSTPRPIGYAVLWPGDNTLWYAGVTMKEARTTLNDRKDRGYTSSKIVSLHPANETKEVR